MGKIRDLCQIFPETARNEIARPYRAVREAFYLSQLVDLRSVGNVVVGNTNMNRKSKPAIHAPSPLADGYTLCNITHEGTHRAKFANPGGRVNCPHCRVVVNYCKVFLPNYRTPVPV